MENTKTKQTLKVQLDTANRTIKLEGNVNLGEFMKQIKLLLPKDSPFGSFDQYTLETNTVITYWNSPVYVPYQPYYQNPWWDISQPYTVTCGTNDNGITYTSASTTNCVYNLELELN